MKNNVKKERKEVDSYSSLAWRGSNELRTPDEHIKSTVCLLGLRGGSSALGVAHKWGLQ